MYRNTFQKRLFSIFNSSGGEPLKDWRVHKKDGYIKRIYENQTGILVLEMVSLNSTLHYITTPRSPEKTLGISMPILNLLLRNLNKCFSFQVTVRDDNKMRHRFRCGNFIKCSSIQFFETTIPLTMCGCDWVLVYFNLAEFTRRSYNTNYIETDRVQINGNIHLRRIFFSDRIIEYADLPRDYQIIPVEDKKPGKRIQPPGRPPTPILKKKLPEASRKPKPEAVSKIQVSTTSKVQVSTTSIRSTTSVSSSRKMDTTTMYSSSVIKSSNVEDQNPQADEIQADTLKSQPVDDEVAPPADADFNVEKNEILVEVTDLSTSKQEVS